MEKDINSKWTMETGRWDHQLERYEDRKVVEWPDKILKMEISDGQSGKILKFIGGPTGFESYCINELVNYLSEYDFGTLCICGGTINTWPRCEVSWKEVRSFLQSNGFIKED